MKKAHERARLMDLGLTAYDFESNRRVAFRHQDDSYIDFTHAFYLEEDNWYFIYTEHHGFYVYHKEDIKLIRTYVTKTKY